MESLQGTPGLVAVSVCVALVVLGVVLRRRRIAASKASALVGFGDLEHVTGWRVPLMASDTAFEHVESAWPAAQMAGDDDDDCSDSV